MIGKASAMVRSFLEIHSGGDVQQNAQEMIPANQHAAGPAVEQLSSLVQQPEQAAAATFATHGGENLASAGAGEVAQAVDDATYTSSSSALLQVLQSVTRKDTQCDACVVIAIVLGVIGVIAVSIVVYCLCRDCREGRGWWQQSVVYRDGDEDDGSFQVEDEYESDAAPTGAPNASKSPAGFAQQSFRAPVQGEYEYVESTAPHFGLTPPPADPAIGTAVLSQQQQLGSALAPSYYGSTGGSTVAASNTHPAGSDLSTGASSAKTKSTGIASDPSIRVAKVVYVGRSRSDCIYTYFNLMLNKYKSVAISC
ncbi:unnamed protein product [Amoebophrya sp. A120]|nr:unnamed protein product [Amoebophrya sp. A120]|eukprot:GSA120T00023609001.1